MIRRSKPRQLLMIVGLLLLAYALRLFRLDYQSLWWDEGISLHLATSSLAGIVADRLNNIHPPLYFFILKGWLALVGVSPFTGRYLSVLAGLGQVAILFSAARYWGGRAAGRRAWLPWLAAALLLLSPLSVIYSQEIRVYALLPLAYVAMLLLAGRVLDARRPPRIGLWLALGLVQWTGLHLHYIAIFAVAYIGVWGAAVLYRRRDFTTLRRWVAVHALVALASLPWLLGVAANWAAITAEANAGTYTTEAVPLGYLFRQVWAFHLTGLAGALASEFVRWGSGVAAVLMVVLFALVVARRERGASGGALRLAAHWLVPLALGLAVWSVRSFSHPRYIIMYAVMLFPLVAWLVDAAWRSAARRWVWRVVAALLLTAILALSVWGLNRYFFDVQSAKPDMRGVARYLETAAAPGDLILIPDTDWSLPFEYAGGAAVLMPHVSESPHETGALSRALDCVAGPPCAESGRVFVVDYPRGTRDWQNRLPFELARRGHLFGETAFEDLTVREYRQVMPDAPLPRCDAAELAHPMIRFGSLMLESVWIAPDAASDTALAVALCWRAAEPIAAASTAALVLRDPVTGERLAQADATLVDSAGAPTDHWPPGASIVTYHLLPLPPGTPPIEAELLLGVNAAGSDGVVPIEGVGPAGNAVGQLAPVGRAHLDAPVGLSSSPYGVASPPRWDAPVEAAEGLQLAGARFNPGPYRPGQTIRVGLLWHSTADSLRDMRPRLLLEQGDELLAENDDAPANGRHPTSDWQPRESVFEYRDVRAPAGVEGEAKLVIEVDGRRIDLGTVAIEGQGVLMERPPVTSEADVRFGQQTALIGYDAPPDAIRAGEAAVVTLYWESLSDEIPASYAVFVHLLAPDGRLLAQHDGLPAGGSRPTNEWLQGEFVVDFHELDWRNTSYAGEAQLAVGLYDPASGERLRTADGADSFRLPPITILPAD